MQGKRVVYVCPIGCTAATQAYVLAKVRDKFQITDEVLLVGNNLVDAVRAHPRPNISTELVVIHAFKEGAVEYVKSIRSIVKGVVAAVNGHRRQGRDVDEIVVSTSGGTEKMSLIVRDAADVIKAIFPHTLQIWAGTDGYEDVFYSVKPKVDIAEIVKEFPLE